MMRKTSVIPVGMTLVGEVEGDADLVVFGRVEGPVHVGGSLVIELGAVVRGHVRGRSVTVRGVLKGDAFGDELVRVDEGARLVGELTAPRVQVTPGAHFRGQIHVGQVGEPHLSSYDPRLHTFSGWPAPETSTSPGTTWAGTTSSGTTSPGTTSPGTLSSALLSAGGHRPLGRHEDRGDAPRVTSGREPGHEAPGRVSLGVLEQGVLEQGVSEQGVSEQGGAELEALDEESLGADATLSEATASASPPKRLPLGMPRLGRTPGTRRWS